MGKSLKGVELGRGISQRPDGRYHARAIVKGKRVELYNKDLKQLRKEFELAKIAALQKHDKIEHDITFSEYFDTWFDTHKKQRLKSEISQNAYYRRVKNTYCSLLGNVNLKDLTHEKIQIATNELANKKYTPRTIKEALSAVRECLDIATINRKISSNPVIRINVREENEAMLERRVLDNWELPLFIEEAKRDWYYEAYMILLNTGLRIGEFSALTWDCVDFENKEIHINKSMSFGYVNGKKLEIVTSPKTQAAYRTIPFFDGVEEWFKSWKQKQDVLKKKLGDRWRAKPELGDIVFCTSLGSPASRYAVSHSLAKIEKNMQLKEDFNAKLENRTPRKIEHLHPHCLRHSFCTLCFQRDMNPSVIQALMGHSDFAVTTSYLHVLNDKRKEEVAKVGSLLN